MYNSMQIKLNTELEKFISKMASVCNLEQMVLKYIFTADNSHYLADFEAKHLFKVCRLADEEQIKGPAPAEVGHDDGIDWHGGEKVSPWGFKFLHTKKNEILLQSSTSTVAVSLSRLNIDMPHINVIQNHTWRGFRNDADSPIASSMYFLSSGVMVGWAAGLSYDTRIQNKYQNIPKLPGRGRGRKQNTQT